jgi:hypothetical protein
LEADSSGLWIGIGKEIADKLKEMRSEKEIQTKANPL